MTIQLLNKEGEATLRLSGRLDTATSAKTNSDIEQLLGSAGAIRHLTVDAGPLEYISSSGLRILLMLAKRFKDFRIKDVNPEVYDVLNMTGFTKMMTVERALRQLSIEGCELIGVGGVGTVYRLDDDTIIKVFREGTTMGEVSKEITMSKEAFVMGMPTAISFDIVKVGAQYGLPIGITSMAMIGGMYPVTMAGALVETVAEPLGANVLAQALDKGHAFNMNSSTGLNDMRQNAAAMVGCPELALISGAFSQMARWYNIPSMAAGT